MRFGESLIKFEALTQTPLREEFEYVSMDKQIELLDELVMQVKEYAEVNHLPHPSRKAWVAFQKTADWKLIARDAIKAKSFFKKVKKSLDKLANI
jgi:hypothetical protein